jgi:hypothetical protein
MPESARARARREGREREAQASRDRARQRERDALMGGGGGGKSYGGGSGARKKKTKQERIRSADVLHHDKRQRLLGQIEEVKGVMNDNLEKGLANFEATEQIEQKSKELASQAKVFSRTAGHTATRAYWDNAAKKVYLGGAGCFVLLLAMMLIFHWINICEVPEDDATWGGRNATLSAALFQYGEEPDPGERDHFWAWECPTMWMGMLLIVDLLVMGLFWARRKVCCCWCHGCPAMGFW